MANRSVVPKFLLQQTKIIFFHQNPFAAENDWGLMLKKCTFFTQGTEQQDADNTLPFRAGILWDLKYSEAWWTDEGGHPTKKARYDDFVFAIGSTVSVRRSKEVKQDGFSTYTIIDKTATINPMEFDKTIVNGEECITLWLK